MAKLKRPPEFKDTRQLPSKAMLAAIGRAVVISASIEDILHALHWKYAGLNEAVGPVITGDARATRLTEDILRIAKAAKRPAAVIEDLSDIFTELKLLITTRNQCIHWLWERPDGRRKHTVAPPIYKTGHQPAAFTVSQIEILGDALVWIEARLSAHELNEAGLQAEKAKHSPELAEIFVPTPWLNKHPAPNPKQSKNRDPAK
jgi:hypothetical protein